MVPWVQGGKEEDATRTSGGSTFRELFEWGDIEPLKCDHSLWCNSTEAYHDDNFELEVCGAVAKLVERPSQCPGPRCNSTDVSSNRKEVGKSIRRLFYLR